jgi:antitoxin component YwqK of YwqJK toxin-antitoxin module
LLDGKPFTGFVKQRYPNGALECIYRITDGIEHGLTVSWYPSGQIELYRETARNVLHGLAAEWDESGRLLRADRYEEGLWVGPAEQCAAAGRPRE